MDAYELKLHKGQLSNVIAYSPDGKFLAVAGLGQESIVLYDPNTGKRLAVFPGTIENVVSLAFSPDGQRLATGGTNATLRVWEVVDMAEIAVLKQFRGAVVSLAFSPDGQWLAAGSDDKTVTLWDGRADGDIIKGHTGGVNAVGFMANGKELLSAGKEGIVKVWDVSFPPSFLPLHGIQEQIGSLAFSSNGQMLAAAAWQGRHVKVWSVIDGRELLDLPQGGSRVAFSPEGTYFATGGEALHLWDGRTGAFRKTLQGASGCLAFSPDGKLLATGDGKLWDVALGTQLVAIPMDKNERLESIAFSPDGRRVATAGWGQIARVWDTSNGQELSTLPKQSTQVHALAFSPDGEILATSTGDFGDFTKPGEIRLWHATTGKVAGVLRGHRGGVNALAFSPTGNRLASASEDGLVKIWDVLACQDIFTLEADPNRALAVAFSPDGNRLATAGIGIVKVWTSTQLDPSEDK
jgi:WD40 repeat protein